MWENSILISISQLMLQHANDLEKILPKVAKLGSSSWLDLWVVNIFEFFVNSPNRGTGDA